ncbi:MAG: BamA/TamA family outer membrane protein [Ignavibacteria bacterium]|nr:BamA/TamA family outer membrane protein [Ignavibacteria bacterium]
MFKAQISKYLKSLSIFSFTFIFLSSEPILAQFGQNKVQYKVFDWHFIQTKHFDIYFTQGGEYIAQFTAFAAESALASLNRNIGYSIKNRIPIIVFNSHNEFQQNNAVDEYLPEGVGGVTELFKNRILVPFEGDYAKFRHVIHHELLHAYMNDMYYDGSIQNIITQNIRLQFPLWFSEGQAEYQSLGGNDKENDMFIRDAVIYDYLPPVQYLDGYLAYRGGQSFFAWLADEYGKEKIGELFHQIKAVGDVEEGFFDIYNMEIETLSEKWHKALKQMYWPDINIRQELNDFAVRITNSRKGDGFYNTAPALSPDGKKIAFISNRDDYFDVFIADVKRKKIIKKIIEGNTTANFEELHLLTPGLCWSPDGRKIAISVKSGDKDAVYVIDTETEDEYRLPIKFNGIFSIDWNPKNTSIVLRGDNSKQSDIWIYDIRTKKLTPVTNDIFSDLNPKWSSDGKKIYFTSDRGDYTDPSSVPQDFKMTEYNYNRKQLYVYDTESGELERFSKLNDADEYSAVTSPDGKRVLFISDRNGISNIWLRDTESGDERPITNSMNPIGQLSLSGDGKRLAFTALNKGGYDIFYIENPFEINLNMTELPHTVFSEKLIEGDNPEISKSDSLVEHGFPEKDLSEEDIERIKDNLKTSPDADSGSVYGHDVAINLKSDKYDTLKPVSEKYKLKEKSKFQVTDNLNEDGSFKINKYKVKFSPDIIYSNASYSSFYGVQGIAQMAFSDVLGNHRIYIATSLVLDLKNSDYAFGYYYLPKRIDWGFSAYHSARFLLLGQNLASANLYRYRQYGGDISLSYPISRFKRIDGALSFARLTKENLDNPLESTEKLDFAMPVMSYVFDNTLFGYTAPIKGTRYNLTLLGTPKIGTGGISFFSALADYRTYFELVDDYNFVFRFNAGVSVGKNPQRFYIGETENWINYEVQNDVLPIEDIKDFAFSSPVLPLRGFNYNARSGSKFMLMNAEFRFPLFRYLVLGALPVGFQNIQGVLFTDVGTVWRNTNSLKFFHRANGSLQTRDLLIGMGLGARLFFLYFPLKFDVAWSYDLKKFSKPKYYISIGADF